MDRVGVFLLAEDQQCDYDPVDGESFAKGVLETKDIIFFLNFTFFFLFLTLRSLESKRWRG